MNIRDLEYLIALADHKHYRKAADACNVSQPTLSGQLRKLEDELGTMLVERTSRKVLFTQSGLQLVEQAKVVLREVKIFKEMATNQGREMAGPLHVGIIPTLGPYLSPLIVPMFKSRFPDLELYLYELQTPQLIDQLQTGQLDCGILALGKETEPFIEQEIFKETMFLATAKGNPWAKRASLQLADLKGEEMLMLDDGHCLREQTLDYCLAVGAKENPHFKASSLETLRNMVAAEMGIALMPDLARQASPASNLHYVPFQPPSPYRIVGLIYRPGSPLKERYIRFANEIRQIINEGKQ